VPVVCAPNVGLRKAVVKTGWMSASKTPGTCGNAGNESGKYESAR
jgi:hypothetical protein